MIPAFIISRRLNLLTIYDLKHHAVPLMDLTEIKRNRKINAVSQIDFTTYRFDRNAAGFDIIQERSIVELPEDGQQYRVLNRHGYRTGDTPTKDVTAYHVLHDLGDREIHKAKKQEKVNTTEVSTGIKTIGTISTMVDGGAPVYSYPVGGSLVGQKLANGTDWRIDRAVTVNGSTWYRVSTNGWVNEKYLVFDKDGDSKPENTKVTNVLGQGTIKAAEVKVDKNNTEEASTGHASGTVATMDANGAPTYSTPGDETTLVKNVPNGGAYQIDLTKTVDGVKWYRISTNQWISEKYLPFNKPGDIKPEVFTTSNVDGQGTIKSKKPAKIYDSPWLPQNQVTTIASGQFKVNRQVTKGADGKKWYQIGNNEWITSTDIGFDGETDVAPTENESDTETPTSSKVYDSPTTPQKETGQVLNNGSSWHINGEVTDGAGGKTWYRVSSNGWVSADDFDFSGKTDVAVKEIPDDEDPEDTSFSWTLGQFMAYLTAGTPFSYTIFDDFLPHKFDDLPEGNALDLFLNDGVQDYGYEYQCYNYHINLYKKIGWDNSFVFIDNGNVNAIESTNDDSSIKTHIEGEFTLKNQSSDGDGSEPTEQETTVTAEYTSPNIDIYGPIDDEYFTDEDATTKEELIQHLKNKLQDYPLTQITLNYHEFQENNLLNNLNNVDLGNSGFIKDRYGVDIKARIIEVTDYLQSPTNKEPELTFGNIMGDLASTIFNLDRTYRNGAYKIINNL